MLHLGVHDVSRMEWIVELPLPATDEDDAQVELEMSLEVPAQAWTEHDPWERLQLLARLGSPSRSSSDDLERLASVDTLRRSALAAAHRAKVARRDIIREILGKLSLPEVDQASVAEAFCTSLVEALEALRRSRDELGRIRAGEPSPMGQQRSLAAEFLSNHAIELISRTQRTMDEKLARRLRPVSDLDLVLARVRPLLARALAEELRYRAERAFASPGSGDPVEAERFLARASSLKKHFQQILFLDVSSELANRRFSNWVSVAASVLAALCAIPASIFFIGGHGAKGFGLGLTSSLLVVILAYGLRERVKEGVRGWLNNLTKGVGRLTEMSLPGRPPGGSVRILRGRESFRTVMGRKEDALYPELGPSLPVVELHYQLHATLRWDSRLARQGADRAKLVYRYDLSPLFSRLHDATEEVPVLAEDGQALRFAHAPRFYRMPVRVRLSQGGRVVETSSLLVSHKMGLVRMEADPEAPAPARIPSPPKERKLTPVPSEALQR